MQQRLQRRRVPDLRSECVRRHPQRIARDLTEGLGGGSVGVMEHREADHALVTDRRRLDSVPVRHDADDGRDTGVDEVHVGDGLVDVMDEVADLQRHRLEVRGNSGVLLVGECSEYPVAGACCGSRGARHRGPGDEGE